MRERLAVVINAFDDAEFFDAVIVEDQISPGKVTITGHDWAEKWETKEQQGATGEVALHKGQEVRPFQLTFDLVLDPEDPEGESDFDRWQLFAELLRSSTSGPEPRALFIFHPDLASNMITSVVLVSIGGMIRSEDPGRAQVQVVLRPYDPARDKPVKPATAGGGSGSGSATPTAPGEAPPKPDPNAAAKEELAQLLDAAEAP